MERDCKKCIHHISGACNAWECNMETLEDYRGKVIDEFCEKICDICSDESIKVVIENRLEVDAVTLDGLVQIAWNLAEELKGVK